MITGLRKNLSNWAVRILFLMLAAAFGLWGIADVVRNMGASDPSWVARVGNKTITSMELDAQYRQALAQAARAMNTRDPSPELKRSVLSQSFQRLVAQAALAEEARQLGVTVTDAEVRNEVFSMPLFAGTNGQFDHAKMVSVLQSNGMTEPRLLQLVKADIAQRQVLEPVRSGVTAPAILVNALYQAQHEQRTADILMLPFDAVQKPAAPDEAVLQRWYDNHPDRYSAPELRRIKAVELTAEGLAKSITVTDADIAAAYDANRSTFQQPEKRTVRIVTVDDQAHADAIAQAWRSGADWDHVQDLAKQANGSAIELPDATPADLPSKTLADAVFAATPETIGPAVSADGRFDVIRVTHVSPPSNKALADVHDTLRDQIAGARAAEQLPDRATKVEDVFAQGTPMDQLPNDLGLVAVAGSLDSTGKTADGKPAPIPGPPELRAAIVKAAFDTAKGTPPHLTDVSLPGGGTAYYALVVDQVTPSAKRPFAEVRDQVIADWQDYTVRHAQETAAAKAMTEIRGGASFADISKGAGAGATFSVAGPMTREGDTSKLPSAVVQPLFALKLHEPNMIETDKGFVVFAPASIKEADVKADPTGYDLIRTQLARAAADDFEVTFVNAVQRRAKPEQNTAALQHLADGL